MLTRNRSIIDEKSGQGRGTEEVSTAVDGWRALSMPPRWTVAGISLMGTLGAIVGLFIGVHAYPPTAPVAMIELGLPAGVLGGIVGMVVDLTILVSRRVRRRFG